MLFAFLFRPEHFNSFYLHSSIMMNTVSVNHIFTPCMQILSCIDCEQCIFNNVNKLLQSWQQKATSLLLLTELWLMPDILCTSTWAGDAPVQITSSLRGSGLLPNTWFLAPTRVHTPNAISIGSSVLARFMVVTSSYRHTEDATVVAASVHCMHAMRPSNCGSKLTIVLLILPLSLHLLNEKM